MKIDSYAIQASSERSYQKVEHERLGIDLWGGGQVTRLSGEDNGPVQLSLSDLAKEMLENARGNSKNLQNTGTISTSGVAEGQNLPQSKEELKLQMLESFLQALTGKRTSLRLHDILRPQGRIRQPAVLSGFGVALRTGGVIEHTQFQYERESTSYNAQGVIKTADGKTINVDVSLNMSREFMQYSSTRLEFGAPRNLVDPLVINYGGNAASLTGEKYSFDLDADGVMDQISFAGPGSGFLALDKNGDGQINDGNELFGPNTGNGFGELRGYDKDGNGWIDESDDVFSKLRIWSKDANGKDQLFTLQELGIGAIYLGDVATEFSMTDAANNTQGVMRSTSFFLRENGGAGTISHIDLKV